jgi:putative tricarboxylic transport membrane protein
MYAVRLVCSLLVLGVGAAAGAAAAQGWTPAKNVEIVVSSGAGGVSDRSARVTQKLLQANPAFPSLTVANRPGGGGTVAWTYLSQQPGDPHYISTFSSTMITNQILGVGKLSYRDFTPLTVMLREYPVLMVNNESSFASGKALLAQLAKDPSSVSFAFASSPGNHNHIIVGMVMKAAGVDPKQAKVVIQKSGGAGLTAMLGGHIDVLVGAPAHAVTQLQGGKARVIGISAPQRQKGPLSVVPTLREQGIDAVFSSWRGFIAPKGLTAAQIAFWDEAFAKATREPAWQEDLERNAWTEDLMNHAETMKHLDREHKAVTLMLNELGVVPGSK